MSWQETRLDQLGYVSRGKSKHRPRDAAHLYDGPFPFIQTGDIKRAGLYLTEFEQTYSEAGLAQSKLWPKGTLCITIAANIADTTILGVEACFPDSVIGFIPDKHKADARFIKYLFDATLQRRFQQFTRGATQDNLSQAKLLSLALRVPGVEEQKIIADSISSYDDLIENNRKRIKLLERAARLLYTEWFVRGRFPGHQGVKVKDGVPEGWEKLPSDEVMDIGSGGTPRTHKSEYWDGDIPFFTPKDVTDSIYSWETERTVTEEGVKNCNTSIYPKDTVYITARGTVGNLCMGQRPMAMNQSCFALQAKPPLSQYYLLFALKEAVPHFQNQSSGSVFDAIVRVAFTRVKLIVPTKEVVDRFTELVTPMVKQVDVLSQQNRQLTRARDLLLPRLMSGKVGLNTVEA